MRCVIGSWGGGDVREWAITSRERAPPPAGVHVDYPQRIKRREEGDAIVGGFIKERTLAENIAFFEEPGVTAGPVYDIAQFLDDPQVQSRGIVVDAPDDEMGGTPMHAPVPRRSRTPGVLRTPAPTIGQHNDDVYARIGYSAERRAELRQRGVI